MLRGLVTVCCTMLLAAPCRAQDRNDEPTAEQQGEVSRPTFYDIIRAPDAYPETTSPETEELSRIDRRLADVNAERRANGLAGPITMVAVGGTTLLSTVTAVMVVDSYTNDDGRAAFITYGAFAAVGGPLLVGGIVFLKSRVRHRREMMPELRELKERRRVLQKLASGTSLVVGGARVAAALAVRF